MSNGVNLNFLNSIEKNEIEVLDEGESIREKSSFNVILKQYENVVFSSLVSAFGLDFLLFKDRDGGDIQTVHNAKNGVFADDKFEKRYEDTKVYNRANYEDKNKMTGYKKDKFKNNEHIYSGYTGKELKKDGSTHTEHIVSASEYSRDERVRLFQSEERHKEIINSDSNFTLLESNVNQSKSNKTMDEFLNTRVKGQEKANAERFGIDRKNATNMYNNAKKYINREIIKDEMKYYTKSLGTKGIASATKMGLRQALGIVFAEVWFSVKDELPQVVKKLKNNFSLENLFRCVGNIISKAINKVQDKYKDILESFKNGAVAGFFSTVSTTIVNIFFTTAKNAIKVIRQSWASLVEAFKILAFNPNELELGEKIREVSKIIGTSISVICGTLIQEAVSKIVPSVPIIGEEIPMFLGTIISGVISVTFLYFIDNSKKVKEIVEYFNKFKSENQLTIQYFKQVNKYLNEYVAKLLSIDIKAFESEIDEVHKLNMRLRNSNNIIEFNNILYSEIRKKGIEIQFETHGEFNKFMKDKNTKLVF